MTDDVEILVEGSRTPSPSDAARSLTWIDRAHGVAVIRLGPIRELVVVEGGPNEWAVTVRGRRITVHARSHRARLLAETGGLTRARHASSDVRASLPGLVVRVLVEVGQDVAAGDALVTIEAMKMQNEIRAPRAGRVAAVEVAAGQAIATGAALVRLVELEP